MAKSTILEQKNFRRGTSKHRVSSWLKRPRAGHDERSRKIFLNNPAFYLIRFGWMRVTRLDDLLKRLIETRGKCNITPNVFRQAVLDEVNRIMSLFKSIASTAELKGELPGFIGGLTLLSKELSKPKISWMKLKELGERVMEGDTGENDYLESLGQLLSLALELKWLLSHQKVDARSHPKFCPLCWRFAVFDTKYCPVHTPSNGNTMGQTEKRDLKFLVEHGDCYSYARRLQPHFLANLKKIQATDRREKRKSAWLSIIGDHQQMIDWLASFRPGVLEVFGARLGNDPLMALAKRLDQSPEGQSRIEESTRKEFDAFLAKDPGAVFEAAQRAEAWLTAVSERQSNWGGARMNAGRPIDARRD